MGSCLIRGILLLFLLGPAVCSAQEEVLSWSPELKLSWQDFRGIPEKNSRIAAVTASGISYKFNSLERDGYYEVDFKVETFFYPFQSWYQAHMCDELILSHEQLHFDISELFARKMRRQMENTRFTENVKKEIRSIYQQILKEMTAFQDRYDSETDFSRNREVQLDWNLAVKQALGE